MAVNRPCLSSANKSLPSAALARADRSFFEQSRRRCVRSAKGTRGLASHREARLPIFHDHAQARARQKRRSGLLRECLHDRWQTLGGRWPLLPTSNLGCLPDFRHGPSGLEQLREIYYGSHIFLHSSHTGHDGNQEGIPNSMLEAMASGLPVFATDHGGIPEAIEHGVSGVLVPERDHEKLAAALLDAAKDPGFLSRIARNGAEIVRKNFDLRAQAQRLEEIYLRTIQM